MKIGIITFHASYNCGSILQCIALKKKLEDKGLSVDIINFSTVEQQKLYSVFYGKLTLKNLVKNFLCIHGYRKIADHYLQYKEYITQAFNLEGDFYHTSDELKEHLPKYDMLIAGGDQVWNVNCDDFSTAYFLDFDDDTYKISFSPSLGATNINYSAKAKEYGELLSHFNDISCREVNGAKWLEQLTGRKIRLVADPTLLLTQNEWISLIHQDFILPFEGDFIFYYAFSYSSKNNERIQDIAEDAGLKVVVIDAKQWYIKGLGRYRNFVLCDETGPNAFLNLMLQSKYVITTSFHGTAFSLNFHKKFVYINNKNHEPTDDRTSFLLEQMGLMEKYIFVDEVSLGKLDEYIDYAACDKLISEMRNEAQQYLETNIEKARGIK